MERGLQLWAVRPALANAGDARAWMLCFMACPVQCCPVMAHGVQVCPGPHELGWRQLLSPWTRSIAYFF
jgi:hypothetical protein